MPAPPLRTGVSGTPSRATANTAFGALYDYVTGLLGATGNAAEARAALGVPQTGPVPASGLTMATARILGRTTAATGAVEELTGTQVAALLPAASAASETAQGVVELATAAEAIAGTDALRAVTPAGLRSGLNASGSAPVYACRAWINFNGTGTVAIRASGNVSSITDLGVGAYAINFISAMPDANYSTAGALRLQGISNSGAIDPYIYSTTSVQVRAIASAGTTFDTDIFSVAIFR